MGAGSARKGPWGSAESGAGGGGRGLGGARSLPPAAADRARGGSFPCPARGCHPSSCLHPVQCNVPVPFALNHCEANCLLAPGGDRDGGTAGEGRESCPDRAGTHGRGGAGEPPGEDGHGWGGRTAGTERARAGRELRGDGWGSPLLPGSPAVPRRDVAAGARLAGLP